MRACSAVVPRSGQHCPVKVAKAVHSRLGDAALSHTELPVSKQKASHVDQKLDVLCGVDSRVTGHVCRVTGAQAMVVSGVELGLVWASAVGSPGHV